MMKKEQDAIQIVRGLLKEKIRLAKAKDDAQSVLIWTDCLMTINVLESTM